MLLLVFLISLDFYCFQAAGSLDELLHRVEAIEERGWHWNIDIFMHTSVV